jgi:DNA-directed RNA polymerase specialized sigma24 family protein
LETIAGEASDMIDGLDAQHRALAECYSRLSATDRDLIDRRYRSGMSIKDLAEQLGRPLRTVYRLFERIHIALLNCIELRLSKKEVL